MTDISQTRDDTSRNQTPGTQDPLAWKSFAGQMAGRFPTAMSQLLRGRGQLRGVSISQLQTDQFRGVLHALACGHMYSWALGSDEGCIWLGLDAPAAAAMIDVILGGRPYRGASGSRDLTAIDRRLLARVLDRAAGLVAGIVGIPQPLARRQTEQMPKPPAVETVCFDLDIGGAMWLFADGELCAGAKSETNGRIPRAKGGPIELSATLNVSEIADDQLARLEVGDVIATDVSVEGEIIVRLAGIPKHVGQLSTVDGKKAITITRKIGDRDG